jgi:anti-sigma regulatory factor (Ser/Thr protein kinase)
VLDTAAGSIRYVRAGHPPPLVRAADGVVTQLNGRGALPVGVAPNVRYTSSTMTLGAGSTLLLYTDGLVERRGQSIDEGIAHLEAVLSDAPESLEDLCDHVLRALAPEPERDDDIALLAVRPHEMDAARFQTTLRAEPTELARLRRLLMRWLRLTRASAQEIYDITIATGEACANAIEHAYGARPARFEVEGTFKDGAVQLCVRDSGNWRAPRGAHRGRGLQLIEALMEDVEVVRGERGTEVRMSRRLSGVE